MKQLIAIAVREWKVFFQTPFAMVVLTLYLVLAGTYFYASFDRYLTLANPSEATTRVAGLNVTIHLLIPFLRDLMSVFVFIIPLITMRSFAEEKKLGTYDLLVSYPVRPAVILMGKYLGSVTLVFGLLGLSLVYCSVIVWKGEPFLPQIGSVYLGYTLFLLFYVASGIVVSLFTENQIVSALVTYAVVFCAVVFAWLAHVSPAPWDRFFAHFLFLAHLESFRNGLIFTGDIAAYVTTTVAILLVGWLKIRRHFSS
ncbi:MAG: ABC-2 transporter permease [Deltaproteobacteria bacterium]|nr:ABC-2 transporter permease [Deltaproteobacteria bacterium]